MKKSISKILLLAAFVVAACACNSKNEPENKQKVDYDQMIGSWNLSSYSVLWKNVDEDKVEKEISYQDGYLVIEKKKTNDGDAYFYKENFALESREEYYGMLEIDTQNDLIYLRAEDGFQRKDNAEIYDFKVSFPAAGKMEWNYSWKGAHSNYGTPHTCQRTVKAVFVKSLQ